MFNVDTIIFDLDGTLLDTVDDLKDGVNYALTKFNYPARTKEEVRLALGYGISKLFASFLPCGIENKDIVPIIEEFKKFYCAIEKSKTKPYDGIVELLKQLKANGFKTGIVSNKFDRGVKLHSEKFFPDLIDYSLGENEAEGILRKPSPIGVYKVMEELKAKKAVFVGDSEVDIQTAKNAGLKCISVLWGFRPKEFLIENGGEVFVNTPSEILQLCHLLV